MKHKILSLVLCCMMLFGTTLTVFAEEPDKENCSRCNTPNKQILKFVQEKGLEAELLNTEAADPYITILHQFKGIKDFETKTTILKVVKVNPLNYVYIVGMNQSDPDKVLYSVINAKQNVMMTLVLADIAENGDVQISEYDSNGTLKSYTKTQAELNELDNQKEAALLSYINDQKSPSTVQPNISIPTNWEYWACQFASWVACNTGCAMFIEIPPAYIACVAACKIAFTTNICDQFR